ncbi:MAG: TetR/AcrR family transcriptional regulator [Hyphomonadaceae bacterium]|nr:MAG: TetR family transcriptional regulator [Caulobacteraceae bacterium]MBT9445366.1 TetR/AcrR family transcriptional regulator [Hyphomonadaceae bacterium]TPW05263.1 MAG: TetR family transcriptional regulator [Alphaproteobacteria bacterium]
MSIVKSRKRRTPEAARENILAAAEGLLVAQGPQALKLADVAAAAGVSNATVLHHFGSIQDVQTALMERMIAGLVDAILATKLSLDDLSSARDEGLRALFDAFEARGAARLAAWLELTGETRRLTSVRKAVQDVVTQRMAPAGITPARAENLVLVSVVLAMGVGLFGDSLAALMGKPPGEARKLAEDLLQSLAQLPDKH